MTDDAVLAADPVFQLNVFLWASQDLPEAMHSISPVLRRVGYRVESLGRPLLIPDEESAIKALRCLVGSENRSQCRPDLYLENLDHPTAMIIELKSQGFSTDSSNVRQAVKLILASHDLAESFSDPLARPGCVVYGTVDRDADELAETLRDLEEAVSNHGASAAPTTTVGISVDARGATLSASHPTDLPTPAEQALRTPATVLQRQPDCDIRPLYIIPWIPGIQESQNPDIRSDGYRELTARIIIGALSMIGQASLPAELELEGETLLSWATFGLFDRWRDTDRRQYAIAAIKILKNRLQTYAHVRNKDNTRLVLRIQNSEERDGVLKLLERTEPDDKQSNLEAVINEPPTLFESL